MKKVRPCLSCVYVKSTWNPKNQEIEKLFEETSEKFSNYKFLKVDPSHDIRMKFYYDTKV